MNDKALREAYGELHGAPPGLGKLMEGFEAPFATGRVMAYEDQDGDLATDLTLALEDLPVPATPEAKLIAHSLLREWLVLFLQKNRKYRKVGNDLGPKGIFPDVNRKVGILRDRVWEGTKHHPDEESTDEVIMDLIGHLFLMLAQRNADRAPKEMEEY